jgi:hypothetical protein
MVKFLIAAAFAYVIIVTWSGDVMAFAGGYSVALLVLMVIMAGEPTVANGLSATIADNSDDSGRGTPED